MDLAWNALEAAWLEELRAFVRKDLGILGEGGDPGRSPGTRHRHYRPACRVEIAERDEPALGYSIIEAQSLDDALALLQGCPMDMWVYEAVPM